MRQDTDELLQEERRPEELKMEEREWIERINQMERELEELREENRVHRQEIDTIRDYMKRRSDLEQTHIDLKMDTEKLKLSTLLNSLIPHILKKYYLSSYRDYPRNNRNRSSSRY